MHHGLHHRGNSVLLGTEGNPGHGLFRNGGVVTEQKTYAQHNAEIHNFGEQRAIDTSAKTDTGNQCAYFLAGHHGINAPVWEFPIGPESLEDLQHAEALEINAQKAGY